MTNENLKKHLVASLDKVNTGAQPAVDVELTDTELDDVAGGGAGTCEMFTPNPE